MGPELKVDKPVKETTQTKSAPPVHSLETTLVGVDRGPNKLCVVLVPSDMSDANTDITDLCCKTVLTSRARNQPDLTWWNYTAHGKSALKTEDSVMPSTVVSAFKHQLVHDNGIQYHMDEAIAHLAAMMKLKMNNVLVNDNEVAGKYMTVGVTGNEPFPNKVEIKMED